MSFVLEDFHKAFDNRIRLAIMSLLAVEEEIDFKFLVKELQISDGNLATHIKTLEKASFIGVKKTFKDRKPHTSYHITNEGRKAFERHLNLLEQLIKTQH